MCSGCNSQVLRSLSLPILGLSGGSFGDAIKGSSSSSFAYGVVDSVFGFVVFIFHFNYTLVLLLLRWYFHLLILVESYVNFCTRHMKLPVLINDNEEMRRSSYSLAVCCQSFTIHLLFVNAARWRISRCHNLSGSTIIIWI